jgi:hypothetical protein
MGAPQAATRGYGLIQYALLKVFKVTMVLINAPDISKSQLYRHALTLTRFPLHCQKNPLYVMLLTVMWSFCVCA